MKILITGATGFVGRTLIPYLFSHSLTDICLLVRDRQKAEKHVSWSLLGNNCYDRGRMVQAGYRLFS